MGSLSIWHWIVVVVVVLLLFGRGKISELMGDMAQGIKAFKKGMTEDDAAAAPATPPPADPFKRDEPRAIDNATARPAETAPAQQRPTGS